MSYLTAAQKSELAAILSDLWKCADRLGVLRSSMHELNPIDYQGQQEQNVITATRSLAVQAANTPAHFLTDRRLEATP